ncbi:Nif3-like dinuclear metal center hexameric protein [Desulfuromonas acetoxidans]|uniref:Nif3-like dinuclear metal center hexameric protein n=1 Tax=Desulfuromonas acetoxidans TaxID=891 RepID=UPI00292FCA6B|nr:Nif3-like dinuclear metal center hexameric protein [Desulfuromonas acetoxidans]
MMAKTSCVRLHDLVGWLNRNYPQSLAEEWDNVGLQVGDLNQEITKVMVALEPTEQTIKQAIDHHCQLLISHHPLLFKPLKKISKNDETGRILFAAIQNNLAIVSAHTNLDHAADGLNDWLAECLDLGATTPLLPPRSGDQVKLVVFVPEDDTDRVATALFKAGAGHIGGYDHCSFRNRGTGTFRPGTDTQPFIGQAGQDERVDEVRLETIVPRHRLAATLQRMEKAHPYEEVAYDLIPLENRRQDIGLGRIGRLAEPLSLEELAHRCKDKLDCAALRIVAAEQPRPVNKVAVCGGSGASLIHEAARQGADVLITGDIKYHEAMAARSLGLALIDAGHFATEHLMAPALASRLDHYSQTQGWNMAITTAQHECDPFTHI